MREKLPTRVPLLRVPLLLDRLLDRSIASPLLIAPGRAAWPGTRERARPESSVWHAIQRY